MEHVTVTCPNCRYRPTVATEDWSVSSWYRRPDLEITCPRCGWDFIADANGQLADDGGLDSDPPCETNPDSGEPDADGLRDVRCPRCARMFETGEAGEASCPYCRKPLFLDDAGIALGCHPSPSACFRCGETLRDTGDVSFCPDCRGVWFDHDFDPSDDECREGPSDCPNCGLGRDDWEDNSLLPLARGWVKCASCLWEFLSPEVFSEILEISHDEHADRPRRRRARVIMPDGSGRFGPLAELAEEPRRGRFVLRAGVHRGPVVPCGGPTLLIGDGQRGSVRVESDDGPCLRVGGGRLGVRGVTFSRHDRPAWPEGAAILLDHGHLWMDDCTIESSGGTGIEVTGSGTLATLRRCRIVNNRFEGVVVAGGATVELIDCEVTGNGIADIWNEGGQVIVRNTGG